MTAEEFEQQIEDLLAERYPGKFGEPAWVAATKAIHYEAVHAGVAFDDAVLALRAAADLLEATLIAEREGF